MCFYLKLTIDPSFIQSEGDYNFQMYGLIMYIFCEICIYCEKYVYILRKPLIISAYKRYLEYSSYLHLKLNTCQNISLLLHPCKLVSGKTPVNNTIPKNKL